MREYLLVFITAFAVTYLLAVLARELAMRFGAFARVRDRDVHEMPIPYFGGVAMLAGPRWRPSWSRRSCRSSATRLTGGTSSTTPARSCWAARSSVWSA